MAIQNAFFLIYFPAIIAVHGVREHVHENALFSDESQTSDDRVAFKVPDRASTPPLLGNTSDVLPSGVPSVQPAISGWESCLCGRHQPEKGLAPLEFVGSWPPKEHQFARIAMTSKSCTRESCKSACAAIHESYQSAECLPVWHGPTSPDDSDPAFPVISASLLEIPSSSAVELSMSEPNGTLQRGETFLVSPELFEPNVTRQGTFLGTPDFLGEDAPRPPGVVRQKTHIGVSPLIQEACICRWADGDFVLGEIFPPKIQSWIDGGCRRFCETPCRHWTFQFAETEALGCAGVELDEYGFPKMA